MAPGLIDAHVHLPESDRLRPLLAEKLTMGITSVREMATFQPEFADSLTEGDSTEFPRVFWSALWDGPPFMEDDRRVRDRYDRLGNVPWLLAVTDTTDIASQARAARELGVTGIKVGSDLEPSLVQAIGEAVDVAGLQ